MHALRSLAEPDPAAAPPRVVVFGAGSVGRGFIGQLFCEAGWLVVFVDANPDLVAALERDGSYPHLTVSNRGTERTTIAPVTALHVSERARIAEQVTTADLVVTSVGAAALPKVADTLAEGLAVRLAAGGPPLDILLAENLHDAAGRMRALLTERLPQFPETTLDAQLGFVETSIGRMIPVTTAAADSTEIRVEPYRQLPYDDAARRGPALAVPGLVADPSVPFSFYVERKLYVHNLGHFLCGLLARDAGIELISEAIADPCIHRITRGAMIESCQALSVRYGRPLEPLIDHVDDLLDRFGNRALGDTVERIIRDLPRKLAPDDRVAGALSAALAAGTPTDHLCLALALGTQRLAAEEGWSSQQSDEFLDAMAWPTPQRTLLDRQLQALRAHGFDCTEQTILLPPAG